MLNLLAATRVEEWHYWISVKMWLFSEYRAGGHLLCLFPRILINIFKLLNLWYLLEIDSCLFQILLFLDIVIGTSILLLFELLGMYLWLWFAKVKLWSNIKSLVVHIYNNIILRWYWYLDWSVISWYKKRFLQLECKWYLLYST